MSAAVISVPPSSVGDQPRHDASSSTNDGHESDKSRLLLAQPTSHLETRLSTLRSQSSSLSSELTARLATSPTGQSLLHIGPSLSSLPPDLHSLLSSLRPLLTEVEKYETTTRSELEGVVAQGREVGIALRVRREAVECAELYRELCGSEAEVRERKSWTAGKGSSGDAGRSSRKGGYATPVRPGRRRSDEEGGGGNPDTAMDLDGWDNNGPIDDGSDESMLDHVASLERAAHTTLHLVQELQSSQAEVTSSLTGADGSSGSDGSNVNTEPGDSNAGTSSTAALPSLRSPLPSDTDKARFLMKLAPRIRRLEADTVRSLSDMLEQVLGTMMARKQEERASNDGSSGVGTEEGRDGDADAEERDLLMVGHCLRGLALLGRGKEAEGAFARVAIMPLIRSKVSMGRLDEGGARGQCTGLSSLLDDIAQTIHWTFGSVLRLSEATFGATGSGPVEIDLVTAGVWAPLVTALMADPAIKMALFSPGIAGILQANYVALDVFLSELASTLLKPGTSEGEPSYERPTSLADGTVCFAPLYFRPTVSMECIKSAQARLYCHPLTTDFNKKWNLPIYYQLRFGESTARLNKAMARVQKEGWNADVYTGDSKLAEKLRSDQGFELPLFLELYDSLMWLWRPDVIIRPLSHRFLRGATQLVGRVVAFIKDGLEGSIRFGEKPKPRPPQPNAEGDDTGISQPPVVDNTYCWGERPDDVAAVSWELTILETSLRHEYAESVASSVAPAGTAGPEHDELRQIITETLTEVSQDISPVIAQCWNDVIADILTAKCSAPLSAVKGIAATYRMTNRPPPKQASPFVSTILRPLAEFDSTYSNRTPPQVGERWKMAVVCTTSASYSSAVEELIATVERTENALKTRKLRRTASGGMSDGDKVKLQLYLDHREFASNVASLGIQMDSVPGLVKLKSLTEAGLSLHAQTASESAGGS